MANFVTKPNELSTLVGDIDQYKQSLNGYSTTISLIKSTLSYDVQSRLNISSALDNAASNISNEKTKMDKLSKSLSTISTLYLTTEQSVVENGTGKCTIADEGERADGSITTSDQSISAPNKSFRPIEQDKDLLKGSYSKWSGENEAKNGLAYASASGSVLNASYKVKKGAEFKDGELTAAAELKGEVNLAQGSVSAGYGALGVTATGTVGQVAATGKVKATILQNGKVAPGVSVEASAEASAVKGEAQLEYGDDQTNLKLKAEGKALTAKATASAGAGYIENAAGNYELGVKAEAKAEACLAKGEVGGGFTIFGVEVSGSVEGKLGCASAGVGAQATTGKVAGSIDLGLGVGVGLKISVDWSNFSLGW